MESSKKVEIYVATHKEFKLLGKKDIYIPIQGGAELYPNERFGYLQDNIGDNISNKKENYNELTSMYWAWKNSNADIKGLCHYRRYFTKSNVNIDPKYIIDKQTILDTMKEYDAILPIPFFHDGYTNYEYCLRGSVREKDLKELRNVIEEINPEYLESYDIVMKRSFAFYCNALIAKKEVFDEYSLWLFNILDELEKRVDLIGYSEDEIRIFGYMGELLLNVWFYKNNIKTKYYFMRLYGEKNSKLYILKCFFEKIGLYYYLNLFKFRKWKEYKKYYRK